MLNRRRAFALGLLALGLAACDSCKKEEDKPVEAPKPTLGGATADMVVTEIGNGLGISTGVPTSTVWESTYGMGDVVMMLGRAADVAVALRSLDKGRTWLAQQTKVEPWHSWGSAADGTVILSSGKRQKTAAPPRRKGATESFLQRRAPIVSAESWFSGPQDSLLSGPLSVFPDSAKLKRARVNQGVAVPAVLRPQLGSLFLNNGPQGLLVYLVSSGASIPEVLSVPAGTIAVPYGRPPSLLQVARGKVLFQAWPEPGSKLSPGIAVPNLGANALVAKQLAQAPRCDAGPWTFVRVGTNRAPGLVAIAGKQAVGMKLPAGEQARLGCGTEGVVVQVVDKKIHPKKKLPQLIRCNLDGDCAEPSSLPFLPWDGKHTSKVHSVATKKGVVAVQEKMAGGRWGVYLAQSVDEGKTFELQRTVAEGDSDRSRVGVAALLTVGERVVLMMTAELRSGGRGFYSLVSDDGGANWGPP